MIAQSEAETPEAPVEEVQETPVDPTAWATALVEAGLAQPIADELNAEADWGRVGLLVSVLLEYDGSALLSDKMVLDALLARVDQAPTPVLMQILTTLEGDFRRDAIRKVIPLLDRDDPAVRNAAMRTLIDQTGRTDLGDDADAWKQWWSEHEWIPEMDWLNRVAMWQAHRAKLAVAASREARRERIQTLRELYSATAQEKRPDLLLRLLRDSSTDSRLLGVELASREVVNATLLSDETLNAAIDLLSDSNAELRAGAARLFSATTSAQHHQSLSKALTLEKVPDVGAAFLSALSSVEPSRADIAGAVRWIADPVAQMSAARVLLAATETGKFDTPSQINAVWKVISDDAGVKLGPAGVRLFGRLAPARDVELLFNLLQSSENSLRIAAAKAIAERGVGVGKLVEAAREDPSLTPIVLEAISFWMPTAEGWSLESTLTGAVEQDLALLAAALPPGEAFTAATNEDSATRRLLLLDRFKELEPLASALPRRELTAAVLLRLQTLLDLGLYEDVLNQSEFPDSLGDNPRFVAAVNVALLALGRFDEAEKAGSQPEVWFDALGRLTMVDSNLAPALARRFRQVWFSDLSDTDRERLTGIEKQLGIEILAMPEKEDAEARVSKEG